jgi:hypothetical protein
MNLQGHPFCRLKVRLLLVVFGFRKSGLRLKIELGIQAKGFTFWQKGPCKVRIES